MRPQQLTLPSRQSLLHGTTENHKPERVQIITIYNCSTKTEMRHTCGTRGRCSRLGFIGESVKRRLTGGQDPVRLASFSGSPILSRLFSSTRGPSPPGKRP